MKIDKVKIMDKLSATGRQNLFVAVGILGILLIFVSDLFSSPKQAESKNSFDLQQYKQQTEEELTDLLKEIYGVGEVKVMITLESGRENIYVQQEKTSADAQTNEKDGAVQTNEKNTYENQFVLTGGAGNNSPIIEKTKQPTIQGVAVVCSGADDVSVVSAVTNSVSVVLNVPTHKICVTKKR